MYWIFGKPRNIVDLKPTTFLSGQNVPRDRLNILVIDDDSFPPKSLLIEKYHFKITQYNDVEEIYSVEAYPIILCDIRGVGKIYQSEFEGARLLSEIRKFYPQKYIIAYTAQTFDPSYNSLLENADQVFKKDMDTDEWAEKLDIAIKTSLDPSFIWKRVRAKFLEMDIPLIEIVNLEDQYIGYLEQKVKEFPSKKLSSSFPENAIPLLKTTAKAAKLLLGD
jgi:hypothetical protein